MLILITGDPGVGKTTLLLRLYNMLKDDYKVGGIISKEIRDNGRVGFEFIDLTTNKRALLASIYGKGPRVGKYHVSLKGCRFAADILYNAEYDIVIVDELGPMEFKSKEFRDAIDRLLGIKNDKIISIHKMLRDELIDEYKKRADRLFIITRDNREEIIYEIFKLIKK
jgi:nucleoside-triphosphatase